MHIRIANSHASYQDPGDLSGLVIDQDDGVGTNPRDPTRKRKTLLAWGQGPAMVVTALAAHCRLTSAIIRKNGFPKVRFYGPFGPPDDPQFRSPMAPHHVAAPLPLAGRNSSTIYFSGFLPPPGRPKLPGQGGPWQAPGVGRGPYDWEISGNEIEVNRFSRFPDDPDNDHGIIEIAKGLVVPGGTAFTVVNNSVRPAKPLPGLVLVTYYGEGRGAIKVGANEAPSPKTMNDWEYRDLTLGGGSQRF